MASNPIKYYINNEPLSIKNVIKYLHYLYQKSVIPHFTLNLSDDELAITTIYSATSTQLRLSGYTIITYNIYTKKWKGSINLASIIDGRLVDKTYTNILKDFPFVVDNNLLTINYQQPYVEYIIESNYIEDVLEPSLNVFTHAFLNTYSITTHFCNNTLKYIIEASHLYPDDIDKFYRKFDEQSIP